MCWLVKVSFAYVIQLSKLEEEQLKLVKIFITASTFN